MKVFLAEHCGFCYGVKRAVDLACNCMKDNPNDSAYTLGPIIHNPQMVERLENQGIKVANHLQEITDGTVIIRSHGVGPEVYKEAEKRHLHLVDATCPHVRKAQQAAWQLIKEGYQVVVIGEQHHPEVKSIVAWSGENTVVVESLAEALHIAFMPRMGVVAQTTFASELFQDIIEVLKTKTNELKVKRTICNATELRQKAAIELAAMVEVMIVVGGRNSANTTRLAQLCQEAGCKTYHVETAQELRQEWFQEVQNVGITAGASTPDWVIEEVKNIMEDFNEAMNQEVARLEKGSIITGKVVSVHKDEVFVDIGYKAEGIIPLAELAYPVPDNAADIVSVNDVIEVLVLDEETVDGGVKLSKIKADKMVAWDRLQQALDHDQPLESKVVEVVKGGVVTSVSGLRGFIPASQLSLKFVEDLSIFLGQTVSVVPIELDKEKNRIILSRRVLLEREQERKEHELYNQLEEGQVLKGVVSRLAKFGAFVDVGGVDGLVHISDLSWHRVASPEEVVGVGDEVEVIVLKVDSAAKRLSLGLKQVQRDPWVDAAATLAEGSIVKGKVSRLAKFGAFVELQPDVEGLVHISELADHHIGKPEEAVTVGQELNVKILSIDLKSKKIALSASKAREESERAEYQDYLGNQTSFGVTIGEKLGHLFKRED
ncbi:hypothetical protein P22_2326 [Propionispora sp. 2/2-37]|uniref:bifunctional 4-hydroxy-3-methylbut-2-enyl diphosphate reductase/30S ribosomal protein S1 n=1 Tax=Propionispora sp. 2/2-37 TaxID=1677858 RepID=UPI0006BB970F|nr:bifunctional 4-hydroxy-3-methylbut-2-enyl diphosphate reductase/30S ribosomal protein S1 [Propionispora sp. 2/2-37]CUH96237.1 hypothetical protein P22_2326 [Propionispora sp. 2/2-37]